MRSKPSFLLMILIALALLLSVARNASAQSSNPRSSQSQVGQAEPSETNAHQQEAETVRAPDAEVPTASHQGISSQQNQHQADYYLEKAWRWVVSIWTVEYTIAFATVIYAFFAILQWCALKKTVDETQGLVKTANRQAKAAENQVVNLEKALLSTEKAAAAAEKNADISERGLALAERPHLIVQSFKMEGFKSRIVDEAPGTLRISYIFKNYGKSPAFLDSYVIHFRIVPRLDAPVKYKSVPKPIRGWILPPGEEREGFRKLEGGPLIEANRMLILDGKAHLIIFGFVDYSDILRKEHRFAFGCRYTVGIGGDPDDRFAPIGQDDYWRYA
jgi:hypothetical protein